MGKEARVSCPKCKGRGTMSYIQDDVLPSPSAIGARVKPEDTVAVLHNQPCRTCKGVGMVKRTEPFEVWQSGRKIGTVPVWFDPARIKSMSWLYSPRPGDFRMEDGKWVASRMLGNGDLEAVPGFVWSRGE